VKILSIRGGGIRGLAVAQLIAKLEASPEMKGQRFGSKFDLIAGTSTGGILAIALSLGLPASQVVQFYLEDGPTIFKRRFMHRLGLVNSKYSSLVLRTALDDKLGAGKTLGDCPTKVMLCASNVKTGYAKFFRSWAPEDMHVWVGAAAQASASAPTYFDSMSFSDAATYEDGGLFANNPALYALVEGKNLLGLPASLAFKNIKLLDISCPPAAIHPDTGRGAIGFVPEAVSMMMDLGMNADQDACASLLGANFKAIVPPLGAASSALDDASQQNLLALMASGSNAAETSAAAIFAFL
jgi:uncharacterized protein